MEIRDKEALEREIDELILSQKDNFYAYRVAEEYFKTKNITNPPKNLWLKIQIYVGRRVKILETLGKIKFVKKEQGKGAFPRKIYKVLRRKNA